MDLKYLLVKEEMHK